VLQAQRLGTHLAATDVKVSHIFSSDLQRAFNTAEAVRSAQLSPPSETTRLEILREQDFGFYEGKHYSERPRHSNTSGKEAHMDINRDEPGFKEVESKSAMAARMDTFLEAHLVDLFKKANADQTIVVVAHGIILSHLWRAVLKRFHPANVHVVPGAIINDTGRGLEHLGGWSNTGYLDLDIRRHSTSADAGPEAETAVPVAVISPPNAEKLPETVASAVATAVQPAVPTPSSSTNANSSRPSQSILQNTSLVVKAVNSQAHLRGLKKTRGGIGSLKHDSNQKTVDSFFNKKQRTD
jgi:broad specificity phosphatase PhoE